MYAHIALACMPKPLSPSLPPSLPLALSFSVSFSSLPPSVGVYRRGSSGGIMRERVVDYLYPGTQADG